MTKKWILLLVALLVLLGGGAYLAYNPGLLAPGPADTTAPTPSDPGALSEQAAYYEIAATYPTRTPLFATAGERADSIAVGLMKGFIETSVTQFKRDGNFANLTPKDIQMMGYDQGRKQSLQIGHVGAQSSTTASYVFTINIDTLGAHGNTYYKTFTFALRDGSALGLDDLFTPRAPYLEKLSSISRAELPKILGEMGDVDMIRLGTAPDAQNFEQFFLDDNSLVILFPPYAVAAYAAGPQTLAIPRSALSDVLKPEYR
jgi:hypothetical protein